MNQKDDAPKSASLFMQFDGYALMRIPTDPDPTDEPRGISGYSFVYADEPDLDRIIRMQPEDKYIRSHSPPTGVFIRSAEKRYDDPAREAEPVDGLVGASVDLEDGPKLENRNWLLTLPGFEPITPFNLRIRNDAVDLYRTAPIDPEDPKVPVWKASPDKLAAQAARGMNPEPNTIGRATGLWDPIKLVIERLEQLEADLKVLEDKGDDERVQNERAILRGRIAELVFTRDNPNDRRLRNRMMVERFSFPLVGGKCEVHHEGVDLGGELDTAKDADWQISFWIGAWDPDTLSAYFQGTLQIPYKPNEGSAGRKVAMQRLEQPKNY